jgi:hypothetical protein
MTIQVCQLHAAALIDSLELALRKYAPPGLTARGINLRRRRRPLTMHMGRVYTSDVVHLANCCKNIRGDDQCTRERPSSLYQRCPWW